MRHAREMMLALLSLLAVAGQAQEGQKEPKRPNIGATADTNDAGAYYQWAVATLPKDPAAAADALYWATRIDPSFVDAFDLRWAALHLRDAGRLARYTKEDAKTLQNADVVRIDSLRLRALSLDPFLDERAAASALSRLPARGSVTMPPSAVRTPSHGDPKGAMGGSVNPPQPLDAAGASHPPELATSQVNENPGFAAAPEGATPRALAAGGNPRDRAWLAYGSGEFPMALITLDTVMSLTKHPAIVSAERGRIFYLIDDPDSAAAAIARAIALWRPAGRDYTSVVYDSKALYEFSLGILHEKAARTDSARAAYGRAIEADPSFAPAFVRMSVMDLARGDTAKALGELDLASQARSRDGSIAFLYASALVHAGHDPEAIEQLRRAVVFEPYYAAPRLLIATVFDAAGMNKQAVQWYNEYLKLAAQHDAGVARAKARITLLSAAPSAPAGPTVPKP